MLRMVSTPFVIVSALWIGCMAVLIKYSFHRNETSTSSKKENYREPIFLNKQKLQCDDYPRANGSIYGESSNIMTGYAFYPKAY